MSFVLGNLNTASANTGNCVHNYKIPTDDSVRDCLRDNYFDGGKHIIKTGDRINVFDQLTKKFSTLGVVFSNPFDGVTVVDLTDSEKKSYKRIAIAGFGDSRISFDSTLSSTTFSRNAYGYITWANYFSRERFVYSNALDLGNSGDSTTALVARLADIDNAIAAEPDLKAIVFQGGTNDANSAVATATVKGNYTTIFDTIIRKGLMLYIIEEFPRNLWTSTDPSVIDVAQKALLDYNDFYATYAAQYPDRVRVLPVYNAFRDFLDVRKSNSEYVQADGVHQEINGAMIVGRMLSQALINDFGRGIFPDNSRESIVTNPFLDGTGGTNSTTNLTLGGASLIPNGWILGSSVSAGLLNKADVSRTEDGALRLSLVAPAGGSTSSLIRLEQTVTLASGAYTLDDVLQAVADIKPVSGTRLKSIGLQVLDDTSGTDYTYQGLWRTNAFNFNAAGAGRGIVATDRFKPRSDTTQLRLRLELTVDASSDAAAIVDVYQLDIVREQRKTDGLFSVRTTAVGNVGTGEDNLQSSVIPANTLNAAGKGVRITAWGTFANNANAKTLKLLFGSATILTNALTTNVAGSWHIQALVFSTNADAQDYVAKLSTIGALSAAVNDIEVGTATQDDGASITIKCTGTGTNDNDIVQEGMIVEVLS